MYFNVEGMSFPQDGITPNFANAIIPVVEDIEPHLCVWTFAELQEVVIYHVGE